MVACPFCSPPPERVLLENESCFALSDWYPISKGHTLIIPRRHVASIFELSVEEMTEIWQMHGRVRRVLLEEQRPEAFNIGVNDGAAAGQTIDHAHVHLIPQQCEGDVPDPRGGIRWVIPEKAAAVVA